MGPGAAVGGKQGQGAGRGLGSLTLQGRGRGLGCWSAFPQAQPRPRSEGAKPLAPPVGTHGVLGTAWLWDGWGHQGRGSGSASRVRAGSHTVGLCLPLAPRQEWGGPGPLQAQTWGPESLLGCRGLWKGRGCAGGGGGEDGMGGGSPQDPILSP